MKYMEDQGEGLNWKVQAADREGWYFRYMILKADN